MDSWAGNNDKPLSLHKYLYAELSPTNGSDPSGYSYQTDLGNAVQEEIFRDFKNPSNPLGIVKFNRRTNQEIRTLLGISSDCRNCDRRPDLIDLSSLSAEVWEIKPIHLIDDADFEVRSYISLLQEYDPLKRTWRLGTSYVPKSPLTVRLLGDERPVTISVEVTAPIPGAVLYRPMPALLSTAEVILIVVATVVAVLPVLIPTVGPVAVPILAFP